MSVAALGSDPPQLAKRDHVEFVPTAEVTASAPAICNDYKITAPDQSIEIQLNSNPVAILFVCEPLHAICEVQLIPNSTWKDENMLFLRPVEKAIYNLSCSDKHNLRSCQAPDFFEKWLIHCRTMNC